MSLEEAVIWALRIVAAAGSAISAAYALWWTHVRLKAGDELFPRVGFVVGARFLGEQDGKVLAELYATLENKGVVPLRIVDFTFSVRGIEQASALTRRAVEEQDEIEFPREVAKGFFMPRRFEYSFVYPGVATHYNTVIAIPTDIRFLRIKSRFVYYDRREEDHYAGATLAVERHAGVAEGTPAAKFLVQTVAP